MEDHIVAGFGGGREDLDFSVESDFDVHEDVEGGGDVVGGDVELGKGALKVLEAAWMVGVVVVHDLEGLFAAGGEEEVIAAVGIFEDFHEGATPVAPKVMAGGDEDSFFEIQGFAG